MARARNAISLGVSALIIVDLILIVGFGAYLNGTFNSKTVLTNQTTAVTLTSGSVTSTVYVTGTSVNSVSDTYMTSCSVTGIGGFQLRVVSDSSGAPVNGETINAVDRLGCDILGQPSQTQVVYLDEFSVGQGGWLNPIFPSQAEPGGQLSFTVSYQGRTYNFYADVPPIGTSCVIIHVPSGNVTTTPMMNGGPCSG